MSSDSSRIFEQASFRIALPSKGRLADTAADLLNRAGLSFRRRERRLHASCRDSRIGIVFANAEDVPVLVNEKVVDVGVTGRDLVAESGFDLTELLKLGFGACRLTVAVRLDSPYQSPRDLVGKAVGTKFPRIARSAFAGFGVEVHLIQLSGALEVMVSLGLVDAIVEVSETGDSLVENRLHPIGTVFESEAILVGRSSTERPHELRDRVLRRIEGVVHAREYSILEYNCPVASLPTAKDITPGFHSPTIQPLADPAWVAVKVMVKKADVHAILDRLEAIGADAILETEVKNCRL